MFALPLLTTKLYSPPTRPGLVTRGRLTERLSENYPLTLICAMPGSGKTSLISEWYDRVKQDVSLIWLSLDEADNDPVRFLTYLITAFNSYQPGIGDNALVMLQSPSSAASSLENVLTVVIHDLAQENRMTHRSSPTDGDEIKAGATHRSSPTDGDRVRQGVMVLDDYHVIESQQIHDAVTFLVDHFPAHWRVILTSRADPPLPLARWRVRGKLNEIRAGDLRFTPSEVVAFLNQVMVLDLSIEDITALEARTEGWIAGLQLAALSMKEQVDRSRFIAAFTGSHRYIVDYLMEEVLAKQPETVREFMMQTSVLDRLSESLCDAVTGANSGQAMLEQLEHANLFLIPLDSERTWYRYHHLFADVLRNRLQHKRRELIPQLYRRASMWFEQNGLFDEAVQYALAAEDFEGASRLIEQVFEASLQRGRILNLWRWLNELPEAYLYKRPRLCLAYSWTLSAWTSVGDQARSWDDIEAWVQRGLRAMSSDDPAHDALYGEALVIRANLASIREDFVGTLELSQQALEILPPESPWRILMKMFLGESYLMVGRNRQAVEHLTKANEMSLKANSNDFWMLTATHLADAKVVQGQLAEAEALYRQVVERAAASHQPQRRAIMAHGGLASVLYEYNQLDDGLKYVQRGLQWIEQAGGSIRSMLVNMIPLARIQWAMGNSEEARETLVRLDEAARQERVHPQTLAFIAAQRAKLALAQGNLAAVEKWARGSGLYADNERAGLPNPTSREFEYAVLARFLIASGKIREVSELLGRLVGAAEATGRSGTLGELTMLQALAHREAGETAEAFAALEQALRYAEPQGIIRTFVDEGEAMLRLLSEWRKRAEKQGVAYADKLLAAFGQSVTEVHHPTRSERLIEGEGLFSVLSERELEVLQLIASGYSNQGIAEALVLTINTVKRHVSHIFDKLDAANRTQAVARARELGLI